MTLRSNCRFAALVLATFASSAGVSAQELNEGLIAHWKLAGDARDHSAGKHDAKNHGVDLKAGDSARLDGRGAHLEVADSDSLHLGAGDFTLALWVHTEDSLDDVIGDLVSKYDPARRVGFNLSVTHRQGVTHSQANFRQIHFGIDDGRQDQPEWLDHGRP